jgi:uncharacterized protein YggE
MKKTVFMILFLTVACAAPAFAEPGERTSTVEVAAGATVFTMPDTVTLSFAVETDSPAAKAAVTENAERTGKVLAALRKVADKDSKIKTSGFSLSPLYEKGDGSKPSGYRVRNTVILESKRLDKTGTFIDEAAEAGASRISNLTFTSDKEEDIRQEAAVKALKQATSDAEALAKASGLAVKGVLKISYDQRERAPLGVLREAAVAGVQTPIAVGEIAVHANVLAVFEVQ